MYLKKKKKELPKGHLHVLKGEDHFCKIVFQKIV